MSCVWLVFPRLTHPFVRRHALLPAAHQCSLLNVHAVLSPLLLSPCLCVLSLCVPLSLCPLCLCPPCLSVPLCLSVPSPSATLPLSFSSLPVSPPGSVIFESFLPQEDDLNGIHIVAFAEKSDPGRTHPPPFASAPWSLQGELAPHLGQPSPYLFPHFPPSVQPKDTGHPLVVACSAQTPFLPARGLVRSTAQTGTALGERKHSPALRTVCVCELFTVKVYTCSLCRQQSYLK